MPNDIKIFPSLLSANLLKLQDEIDALVDAGIDTIHLDVMDNHYVPNLTFGPFFCEAISKQYPNIVIDVHLMTISVDSLIVAFANAGAHRISIHPEACYHLDRSLQLIKQHNCQAGLALNPATDFNPYKWISYLLDFVLIMTVNPGFGGQKLITECIPKIADIKTYYPNIELCVDGGVNLDNIRELISAGANQFVMGNAFFKTKNYKQIIQQLNLSI